MFDVQQSAKTVKTIKTVKTVQNCAKLENYLSFEVAAIGRCFQFNPRIDWVWSRLNHALKMFCTDYPVSFNSKVKRM